MVGKQQKCGGGGIQLHYLRSSVKKKVECRVDVGSMQGRCRVDVGSMWGQRFERNLLKQSKKASQVLLTPLPFQFYFPPQFFLFPFSTILLFSLLNVFIPSSTIFIIFPPQCFLFPSSTSTSSFILYIFPSTNTSTSQRPYIDPTSTLHRPHIDPTLNFFFNTAP